jgi:AraC family transcriptional regulator
VLRQNEHATAWRIRRNEGHRQHEERFMGESTPVVASVVCAPVQFTPPDIAQRDIVTWNGIQADAVTIVRREPFAYSMSASCHMLILLERGERDDGETRVEGLPTSTLRDFSGRLSFVPRGHKFSGWQMPRVLSQVTYFYIDPNGPLLDPELRFAETEFQPRLFFQDRDLYRIASKLKAQPDDEAPGRRQYAESLSILLAHELLRLNNGARDATHATTHDATYVRGGLAARQRKQISDYVEEHLAENVPLATLADVAKLSPFHFARAFKESFGMPPHRYLTSRRVARAKTLLADPATSVTQVGVAVGFGDTSAFTTAFRRHTGVTPTSYRRSLD